MHIDSLLIFCSGYTLSLGWINLAIGFSYKKDRSYLYFGLLSLFASFFLHPSIFGHDYAYIDAVNIGAAAIFYGLFIWFIGEFTGKKSRVIQWILTYIVIIAFLGYLSIDANILSLPQWEFLAHFTILSISIYGIAMGLQGLTNRKVYWKWIYLFLMLTLGVFSVLLGLQSSFDVDLHIQPIGGATVLDFFPIFFSIIIGSKLSHNVIRSYYLEKEVTRHEKEWAQLMEAVSLVIVKMDLTGKVIWANNHLTEVLNYSLDEVIGKNWFELIAGDDKAKLQNERMHFFKGQVKLPNQSIIKTKNGLSKSLQWSNLSIHNNDNEVVGFLHIGADVTERENAIREINALKDQLKKENLLLREEVKHIEFRSEIIGNSDALKYVLKRAQQVASTNSTVLLEGETGVGKDLFANMIYNNSLRRYKPFIKVNCASLPEGIIESELFGHEKGAFTSAVKTRQGRFELADNGTIFLDEIGELPTGLQAKLLRVLQTGEFERVGGEETKTVDVRIIAATNRNLQEEVQAGNFRQDLYFRINVYPITIPPLRSRKEDISTLVRHFSAKIGKKIGRVAKNISKADITKLQEYTWPGNVRELENVIERAIINSVGDTIKLDDAQLTSLSEDSKNKNGSDISEVTLNATQKSHIVSILEACNWKINGDKGAAHKLGMPPSTLRSKMKKLGIERPY